MTFTRVHHVGMVTGDLEQARHVFSDGFGLSVDEHRTPWPTGRPGDYDGVTTVEFPIGEMYYEVSTPGDSETGAAEFLSSTNGRGGIYYVSIASDDIAEDIRRLTQRGVRLAGDWDRQSAVFLDPSTCLGLKLQITPEDNYYVHPYFRGDGIVTGMAHIGIAARSADEIRHLWGEVFGLPEDLSKERGLQRTGSGSQRPAGDPVHLIEFPLGGTVVEISVPLTSLSTLLGPSKDFFVELKPTVGASLKLKRTTPAELDAVVDLQ